jgi:O-antigen ligase
VMDLALPSLHLPLITSFAALFCALLCGAVPRTLSSPIGLFILAFTLWQLVGLPFAYWRSHSLEVWREIWLKSAFIFLVIVGTVRTVRECKQILYTIALAVLAVSLMSIYYRASTRGRLMMPSGHLSNPNDLAQVLLMGIPFWFLMTVKTDNVPFRRVIALLCIPPVLYAFLLAGSRGALLALVAVIVIVFWRLSLTKKLMLGLPMLVMVPIALVVMSPEVRDRYKTIFIRDDTKYDDEYLNTAQESASQRKYLLKESLRLTIIHPLFGVGMGNFQSASAADASKNSSPAAWRETHNAFTQISSESGIPGLVLYLGIILASTKALAGVLSSSRRFPELKEISSISVALQFSLLSLIFTSFFSSLAYQFYYPTLAGLIAAFAHAAHAEIARMPRPVPASETAAVALRRSATRMPKLRRNA